MDKSWTSHEQFINMLWKSWEQIINKLRIRFEQHQKKLNPKVVEELGSWRISGTSHEKSWTIPA